MRLATVQYSFPSLCPHGGIHNIDYSSVGPHQCRSRWCERVVRQWLELELIASPVYFSWICSIWRVFRTMANIGRLWSAGSARSDDFKEQSVSLAKPARTVHQIFSSPVLKFVLVCNLLFRWGSLLIMKKVVPQLTACPFAPESALPEFHGVFSNRM